MCSQRSLTLLGPDAVEVMRDVVRTVAERSFFADVEPCEDEAFAALARETAGWLVATIRFTEGESIGAVSCLLPQALARSLFDAFTGRDPAGPPPDAAALRDVAGEFTNIVCGAWLTRLANHQTFTLVKPAVADAPEGRHSVPADARLLLTVNDLPMAVEVRVAGAGEPAAGRAGV